MVAPLDAGQVGDWTVEPVAPVTAGAVVGDWTVGEAPQSLGTHARAALTQGVEDARALGLVPDEANVRPDDLARAAGAGVVADFLGRPLRGAAALYDAIRRNTTDPLAAKAIEGLRAVGAGSVADVLAAPVVPEWLQPEEVFARRPGQALVQIGEAIAPPPERQNAGTDIARAVGQVSGQIAAAILTGGATLPVAMMAAQGADIQQQMVTEAGAQGPKADAAIIAGAGITALTEKYGLDVLLARLPIPVKNAVLRYLTSVALKSGNEAAQEVTEGVLHNLAAVAAYDPDQPIFEGLSRDAIAGGGAGAFAAALVDLATRTRTPRTGPGEGVPPPPAGAPAAALPTVDDILGAPTVDDVIEEPPAEGMPPGQQGDWTIEPPAPPAAPAPTPVAIVTPSATEAPAAATPAPETRAPAQVGLRPGDAAAVPAAAAAPVAAAPATILPADAAARVAPAQEEPPPTTPVEAFKAAQPFTLPWAQAAVQSIRDALFAGAQLTARTATRAWRQRDPQHFRFRDDGTVQMVAGYRRGRPQWVALGPDTVADLVAQAARVTPLAAPIAPDAVSRQAPAPEASTEPAQNIPENIPAAPPAAPEAFDPAGYIEAARRYVAARGRSLGDIGRALGLTPAQGRRVLSALAATKNSGLAVTPTGVRRARIPQTPIETVAAWGGVRDDGTHDLKGTIGQRMVPGFGPLIRPTGLSPSELADRLHQNGFLTAEDGARPDENAALDWLDRAVRGEPVTMPDDMAEAQDARRQQRRDDEARAQAAAALEDLGEPKTREAVDAVLEIAGRTGQSIDAAAETYVERLAIETAEEDHAAVPDEPVYDIPFGPPAAGDEGRGAGPAPAAELAGEERPAGEVAGEGEAPAGAAREGERSQVTPTAGGKFAVESNDNKADWQITEGQYVTRKIGPSWVVARANTNIRPDQHRISSKQYDALVAEHRKLVLDALRRGDRVPEIVLRVASHDARHAAAVEATGRKLLDIKVPLDRETGEPITKPPQETKRATVDQTEAGAQQVITGAERITDAELAQRKAEQRAPVHKPGVAQKPADEGLFDTGARRQLDLTDALKNAPAGNKMPAQRAEPRGPDLAGRESPQPEGPRPAPPSREQQAVDRAEALKAEGPAKPSDLDRSAGVRAYTWSSMTPERGAEADIAAYVNDVNALYADLMEIAQTDKQRESARAEAERFREGRKKWQYTLWGKRSRTASTMVTGPAKFNTRRNEKALDAEQRAYGEFKDWYRRARAAAFQAVNDARTAAQVSEDVWADVKSRIDRTLRNVRDIDGGQSPGFDRTAFVTNLAGYLERFAAHGDAANVQRALDYIREQQKRLPKPIFTDRHSVWRLADKATAAAAAAGQAAPGGIVAEWNGASVERDADRVRIYFPGKPSEAVRANLRGEGWRWSPSNGAWQRQATDAAVQSATRILDRHFQRKEAEATAPRPKGVSAPRGWDRADAEITSTTKPPQSVAAEYYASGLAGVPDQRAAADAFVAERDPEVETLVVLDANGNLIAAQTSGQSERVAFGTVLAMRLEDAEQRLYLTHNHPSGRALSTEDLMVLAMPAQSEVAAVGPSGIFRATKGPTAGDGLRRGLNLVTMAVRMRTAAAITTGEVSRDAANEFDPHVINLAAHKAGLIEYAAPEGYGADHIANPAIARIIDAAADAAMTGLEAKPSGVRIHRATEPLRTARALGAVPRVAQRPAEGDAGRQAASVRQEGGGAEPEPTEEGKGPRGPTGLAAAAWHGSPYTFDKFTTEKIGTGEGHQAFGWGLYFTGGRGIGEHYRKALSERALVDKMRGAYDQFDTPHDAVEELMASNELTPQEHTLLTALAKDDWFGFDYPHQALKAALHEIDNYDPSPETVAAAQMLGRLYSVDLKPAETDYLRWDLPVSQQSEKVRAALESLDMPMIEAWKKSGAWPEHVRGADVYHDLKHWARDKRLEEIKATPEFQEFDALARDRLPDNSIRDQKRWHELAQRIEAMQTEVVNNKPRLASLMLKGAGIPGIKYPAGTLSGAKSDAFNYVIFDEVDVTIEEMFAPPQQPYGPSPGYLGGLAPRATTAPTGAATPGLPLPPAPPRLPPTGLLGTGPLTPGRVGSFLDRLRTAMQDRYLPLLRAQQQIERQVGRSLAPAEDAYLTEELMAGRIGRQLENLERKIVKPMLRQMQRDRVTVPELESFLYARHAPERNARMQAINPNMKPGEGSGMTDAEAEAAMSAVYGRPVTWDATARTWRGIPRTLPPKAAALEAAAAHVDNMLDVAVDTRVRAGLLSHAEAKAWRDAYRHYVPLRGEADMDPDMAPERPRTGAGITVKGKESRRAMGRTSEARDLLGYAIMQAEEAIVRAEKNRVAQRFLRLATSAPDPDFWAIDKVTVKPVWDEGAGRVRYEAQTRLQPEDRDWTVTAKVRGEEHRVTLNRKNPDARRLADAMRNLSESQWDAVALALGTLNRFLSTVNTTLNPEFVVTNALRDLQTALYNVTEHDIDGMRRGILKDWLPAMKAATKGAFGARTSTAWDRWHDEFASAGGRTYFNRIEDVTAIRKRLDADIRKYGRALPLRAMRSAWQIVEQANIGVENGIRLAAYKNARERGLSIEKAASLAKNLTVNFNRRGTYGPIINAAYLFYNAGVQGGARILTALKHRGVQRLVAATVVGGALLDWLNWLLSDTDDDGEKFYDKISEFDKSRNLIVMGPGGRDPFIKIPLGYGYNVFPSIGRYVMEGLRGKPFGKIAADLATTVADAWNPFGGSGHIANIAAPTVLDPAIDLIRNRDFAGRPIMPEQEPFGPEAPMAQRYWSTVSPIWKAVTDTLTRITGGDEVRPGAIDISPEALDYLSQHFLGAMGAFYERTGTFVAKIADPKQKVEWGDIPFVRKVIGGEPTWYGRTALYERADELDQLDYDRRQYAKRGQAGKLSAEEAALLSLRGDAQGAKAVLGAIRETRRAAKDASLLEGLETATVDGFNRQYNEIKKGGAPDRVAAEATRLGITLTPPGRSVDNVELPPDLYARYVVEARQVEHQLLGRLIAQPAWARITDGQKRNAIESARNSARSVARARLLASNPGILRQSIEERLGAIR